MSATARCGALLLAGLLAGCADKTRAGADTAPLFPVELETMALDMGPLPALPPDPSNRFADDEAAAHFGRWLFYDTRLSGSGQFSCATCHDPAQGFGDGRALSVAAGTTARHAPSLWNSAFQRWQFWDGRCDSQWCQAIGPLENDHELAISRGALAHRVHDSPDLAAAYTELFGPLPALDDPARFPADARPVPEDPTDPRAVAWAAMAPGDQDAVTAVMVNLAKAIAAHERELITGTAPLDDFVDALADGDAAAMDAALSPAAREGLELFLGEGSCVFCHSGPVLSNFEFHNLGLPAPAGSDGTDPGRYAGIDALRESPFNTAGPWSDDPGGDQAARIDRIAQTAEQLAQFKVPGLRRVADSAPYFHGGQRDGLTAVVGFYSELPETDAIGHREELLVPLGWSDDQIASVVAFLTEGLSDSGVDPALLGPPDSPLP